MKITSIGMGQFSEPQTGYRAIEADFLPKQEAKVKSIMKLQEEIVHVENSSNFIKQTEDMTPMFKFNFASRLNIV